MNPETSFLPHVIALLNGTSFAFLVAGFMAIRSRRLVLHQRLMMAATVSSALFLTVYLIHHAMVGSVPYPRTDWTRPVYFIILIPHIILAALMTPFVFAAVYHGYKNNVEKHRKIVRYLFPVWSYVSVTGLIVYFMLYRMN